MAGALLEIWLTVSALSSLLIVLVAIGHSDLRLERRLKTRPDRVRTGTLRRRRRQTRRV
ncbi:MAG: hypothetical protein ACK4TC_04575 [Sphingomonas pseudosanguinis]|uniref:hypothetical protein n=1 Tax=Sphingomonas pseudosanguinis TaxID=413712 RepID=UPI00391A6AA7